MKATAVSKTLVKLAYLLYVHTHHCTFISPKFIITLFLCISVVTFYVGLQVFMNDQVMKKDWGGEGQDGVRFETQVLKLDTSFMASTANLSA